MKQPTVYLMIGEEGLRSAIAFEEESGEVLETVDFNADGTPDWKNGGYCDHRGGAGPEGFDALVRALEAGEENARGLGYDPVKRVPKEDRDL